MSNPNNTGRRGSHTTLQDIELDLADGDDTMLSLQPDEKPSEWITRLKKAGRIS